MSAFASVMGFVSLALALYCMIPYWKSILDGRTKPHQFSWIIFSIMNVIVTTSQILEGARASVLISIAFAFGALVNLALSFKFGTRGTSRLDIVLFALALVTIATWLITKDNAVAIWLTVLIDVFATSMIILKLAHEPDSEDPMPWAIATVAFGFSCLSLIDKPPSILYVRPIYGFLSDVAVVAAAVGFGRLATKRARSVMFPGDTTENA